MNKLFVADYIDLHTSHAECLVVEADSIEEAKEKAISELKALNIPKRYLLNIEEVI